MSIIITLFLILNAEIYNICTLEHLLALPYIVAIFCFPIYSLTELL